MQDHAALLANYAYSLGATGNRLSVTESGTGIRPSGAIRTASYAYDALCRLSQETISGDVHGHNGVVARTAVEDGPLVAGEGAVMERLATGPFWGGLRRDLVWKVERRTTTDGTDEHR